MNYLLSFLEGIITFISPCLLPMLPIYVFYFTGEQKGEKYGGKWATFINTLGFVLGFTIIFTLLGAMAGVIGGFLVRYQTLLNIIAGTIIIVFGLNYLGVFKIGFLNQNRSSGKKVEINGFFSAVIFGMVFSISWTPCVGTFLGSALMLASQQGSAAQGTLMLLFYSLGLGIPFLISSLLIDRLKSLLDGIKKHYNTINKVAGIFLIVLGVLMATGYIGKLLTTLSF